MITYITAFVDINRTNWSQFTRSFDDYFQSFEPFLKLLQDDYRKFNCFIETGTYNGDTTFALEPYFNTLYYHKSIDTIFLP